jgi:hypothetical protein
MKKSILIEGSFHKNHFHIFDYECLELISLCFDLLSQNSSGEQKKINNTCGTNWKETVNYYNEILYNKVFIPRRIKRLETNILINNQPVDGQLIDLLIFFYHKMKKNLILARQKINLLINENEIDKKEEEILLRLLKHFKLNLEEMSIITA